MGKQFNKAVGIGLVGTAVDVAATSGWMHRSVAHKSGFKLKKPLETTARTIIWGNGMVPRYWVWVHRDHHEFADKPGDPHSPWMQGRYGILKVIAKNPFLYRDRIAELKASGKEMPADLRPDRLDDVLYDNTKAGLAASLAGYCALNKAIGNHPAMGVVSFAAEKAGYVVASGIVNGIGHGGEHPIKAIFTGEIEPHIDGSLGADSRLVGLITGGEGNQQWHHDHEDDLLFGPTELTGVRRLARDAIGSTCMAMVGLGWARIEQDIPQERLAA